MNTIFSKIIFPFCIGLLGLILLKKVKKNIDKFSEDIVKEIIKKYTSTDTKN